MSIWQRYSIEARIREILASVPLNGQHFGRPFLTAYQIAIAFERLHPGDAGLIGKPVGGKDTGRYDSLAEYFANQLSRRIDKGTITDIEGRSLDGRFLKCLQYDNRGDTVTSSLGQANMSIFRLAPPERQLAGSRGRPPSSLRGASSH